MSVQLALLKSRYEYSIQVFDVFLTSYHSMAHISASGGAALVLLVLAALLIMIDTMLQWFWQT